MIDEFIRLAKNPTFFYQQLVMKYIITDDWDLDRKSHGKWQFLQH